MWIQRIGQIEHCMPTVGVSLGVASPEKAPASWRRARQSPSGRDRDASSPVSNPFLVSNAADPPNPLDILGREHLRAFATARLERYRNRVGQDTVDPAEVFELLCRHHDDAEVGIRNVHEQLPLLRSPRSVHATGLQYFRQLKVHRLATRLAPFVNPGVLLDFGTQTTDLAEAFLASGVGIRQACVTDVCLPPRRRMAGRVAVLGQPTAWSTALASDSVDTIVTTMVLHHIARSIRRRALSHLLSILKPGGRFVVVEDTCPATDSTGCLRDDDDLVTEFMSYSWDERLQLLAFFDWYGNRVVRDHPGVPLPFTFETMEGWQELFESVGFRVREAEFVGRAGAEFDLMPPKGIFVCERPALRCLKRSPDRHLFSAAAGRHERMMDKVTQLVDREAREFPFGPLSRVGSGVFDRQDNCIGRAVNSFGQQHAERLAILNSFEIVANRVAGGTRPTVNVPGVLRAIAELRFELMANPRFPEEQIQKFASIAEWLNHPMTGNTLVVNLEPCPKCARVIVAAGFREVVYGTPDVNRANGLMGHRLLEANGIKVVGGISAAVAVRQNRIPFFLLNHIPRLYLTLREYHRRAYAAVVSGGHSAQQLWDACCKRVNRPNRTGPAGYRWESQS